MSSLSGTDLAHRIGANVGAFRRDRLEALNRLPLEWLLRRCRPHRLAQAGGLQFGGVMEVLLGCWRRELLWFSACAGV